MGYRRMRVEDLYDIFRRWEAGHSILQISKSTGSDRKTVRQYIERFTEFGLTKEGPEVKREALYELFSKILPEAQRAKPAQSEFERYEDEIRQYIHDEKEPVKAKTAYQIIKRKYGISSSYESFKIFVRSRGLSLKRNKRVLRIELPPGKEIQIDYGKVGLHREAVNGKNRVVWAFCTVLSHSRLPFIQFVYTQKQESFSESFIDSLEYYNGATEFISIDNLKAGVIKPDLWDPKLNKSLAETADYYGVFIDPCRVAKSTDKGKVERFIPVAREVFRMLKKLHPEADLEELNRHALSWCRQEYGAREHGTTGIPPMQEYEQVEKSTLRALPAERYEVPIWKEASVHRGDGFFTFLGKRYAVPPEFRLCGTVWARYTERSHLLRVFYNYRLLREYVVGSERVNYFPQDFPEGLREMMRGDYPRYLMRKAEEFGADAYSLVESVLKPHAYLNARRAQGMLEVMKRYCGKPFFSEVCRRAVRRGVKLPSGLHSMLKAEEEQLCFDLNLPISEEGRRMIRDINYYIN